MRERERRPSASAHGTWATAALVAALALALAPLGRPPAHSALNVATPHGVGGGDRRQIQIGGDAAAAEDDGEREKRKKEKTKKKGKRLETRTPEASEPASILYRASFVQNFQVQMVCNRGYNMNRYASIQANACGCSMYM